jgi:hypothetical protein
VQNNDVVANLASCNSVFNQNFEQIGLFNLFIILVGGISMRIVEATLLLAVGVGLLGADFFLLGWIRVAGEGCYDVFLHLSDVRVLVVLVVEVLEVVLVVVKVRQGVGQAGDASTMEGNFYLVPALSNLENNTADLGIEVVFYLVVASKIVS